MTRYVLGCAAVVLAAAFAWLPGTQLWGQGQKQGQAPTSSPTTHSVKITLHADGKDCRLRPILPERAGFYPGDSVVWNFENGCTTSARVRVWDFRQTEPKASAPRSPFTEDGRLNNVEVAARGRTSITTRVADGVAGEKPVLFEYSVGLLPPSGPDAPPASAPIRGYAYFCREPPCPPVFAQ